MRCIKKNDAPHYFYVTRAAGIIPCRGQRITARLRAKAACSSSPGSSRRHHIMLALPVRRAEKRMFTFQTADHLGRIYFSPRPPLPIALGKFLQAGRIHNSIRPCIKAHTQAVQRLTRPDSRGTKYSIEMQPAAPYHLPGNDRLLHSKCRQRNFGTSSSNNVCLRIVSCLPVPQKI